MAVTKMSVVEFQAQPQLPGSIFSPSQKRQKLSHPFRLCFELGMGILNPPDKIIWGVYESSNEQGSREGVHISR